MKNGYYPLALAAEIGDGPARVLAFGKPYALTRLNGVWSVVSDRCPHRWAPLSAGVIVGMPGEQTLECPYHGWRFDEGGICTAIPALGGEARIPSRAATTEAGRGLLGNGVIWAGFGDADETALLPSSFGHRSMEAWTVEAPPGDVERCVRQTRVGEVLPIEERSALFPTVVRWGNDSATLAVAATLPQTDERTVVFVAAAPHLEARRQLERSVAAFIDQPCMEAALQ